MRTAQISSWQTMDLRSRAGASLSVNRLLATEARRLAAASPSPKSICFPNGTSSSTASSTADRVHSNNKTTRRTISPWRRAHGDGCSNWKIILPVAAVFIIGAALAQRKPQDDFRERRPYIIGDTTTYLPGDMF